MQRRAGGGKVSPEEPNRPAACFADGAPRYNRRMSATYHDLAQRHVLITGGAGGIGEALVREFALQSCRVTFLDKSEAAGRTLADDLVRQGADVEFVAVDLVAVEALDASLDDILSRRGPVNVLINNAGWDPRYDLTQMTWEQWESLFRLNIGHYFVACRKLIPPMIAQGGGSIIQTASVMFWIGFGDCTAYNATKGAIIGMTRSLAREVGRHGIRVNAVAPGWVLTERQLRDMLSPERKKKLLEEDQILPLPISPRDVAQAYLFLASDASRAITRQTLVVDAGYSHS